jgi:hypothetical protein
MIQVTDAAVELLERIDLPADKVLRLEPVDAEHLGFVLGDAQPDDVVVERGGHDLFHIPAVVETSLPDSVMDRVDTEEGPKVALVPTSSA